ncbi:MAG TPA: hypothetical protein VGO11_15120 [Chthoniobacteraceae bacterium]|jgi:hypothetical protein|nr:hypothetical protein [Chthoniobacteraceae bacterium]
MRHLPPLLIVLALAAVAALQLRLVEHSRTERAFLERRLQIVEEENERLRGLVATDEKAKTLERTRAIRKDVEQQVEKLRGLKFREPVVYDVVSRKEIRAIFAKALAEENSESDFINIGRAWTRIGLLPREMPLRQTLLDLLSEQVAAFYNHHEHKLFMFEDSSLDKPYDRVLLAHELTHALQDQYFHLASLPIALRDNDDRALAALSVIEGDATAVMTDFMAANASFRVVLDTATAMMSQQVIQLQKTPRFLRERLVFPYLHGKDFCAAVIEERGQRGVDDCFKRIPSSTTQILHREKYLAKAPEEPLPVAWPAVEFAGRRPATDNVVGEAGIRCLVAEWAGEASAVTASVGWRGDRYLSYEDDTLIWKSFWADDLEAREFFEAERTVLAKRYGPALPQSTEERMLIETPRAVRLIRLLPSNAVVLVDAATAEVADQAEAQFAK